jgi:hypothetical protein
MSKWGNAREKKRKSCETMYGSWVQNVTLVLWLQMMRRHAMQLACSSKQRIESLWRSGMN